jgi:hypothetical protein
LPAVNTSGELNRIVAPDGLIAEIARDMMQAADVIEREIIKELELRPARIRACKSHVAANRPQ